ncbi:hypothetical protein HYU16_03545 [Candidatus Woesearchaeota archaeon]|nr:hypothetical protein [Candidatus Woesearchaeota archaeon]
MTKLNIPPAAVFAALSVFLVFIAAAAVLTNATAVSAGTDDSVSDSAFVTISFVNQDPEPVMPGERLELKFKVENIGTMPADGVTVELLPRFPFSVDESEKTKSVGNLFGRQKGKDAVIVRFFLTIDVAAGSGINPIALRYKTASQGWTVVDSFNVSVGRRDLPLAVTSVVAKPETMVPGKPSSLELEVTNIGTGDAVNVRVRLNLTDTFSAYGSTNEAIIPLIKQKGTSKAAFSVITSPDAKSALYRMPLLITYSDTSGRNYTISGQSFGILVSSEPQLAAAAIGSDPLKLNAKRKVTIEIINSGLSDVKFLSSALAKSENYEILSPESAYVGDLDSGDSETVSYDVFFKKPAQLTLSLEYRDALNEPHQQTITVPVRVYTTSELGKFGLEKSNGKGILITVAIVVVGVLAYRKLRKKK